MDVTRLADAKPYDAARHFDMTGLRLQGHEASPAAFAWVGLSHFLPGGGAESAASALERIYIVTDGAVTVIAEDADGARTEVTLGKLDSCRIAGGETREIVNRTTLPASMLVVMPYPPAG